MLLQGQDRFVCNLILYTLLSTIEFKNTIGYVVQYVLTRSLTCICLSSHLSLASQKIPAVAMAIVGASSTTHESTNVYPFLLASPVPITRLLPPLPQSPCQADRSLFLLVLINFAQLHFVLLPPPPSQSNLWSNLLIHSPWNHPNDGPWINLPPTFLARPTNSS